MSKLNPLPSDGELSEDSHDDVEEMYNDDDIEELLNSNESPVLAGGNVGEDDYSCAACTLCNIKSTALSMTNDVHKCLNCGKHMHGALCGVLWEERGESCKVMETLFSDEGRKKTKSRGALLCAKYINDCSC